ncbi:MAG: hypothetical protein ACYTEX_27680 [Planctomycetota bacterium]|jgi:hypothetical protein
MAQNTILLADLSDEVLNAMGGAGPWQSITAPASGVTTDTVIDVIADTNIAPNFGMLGATYILDIVTEVSGSRDACQMNVTFEEDSVLVGGGFEPVIETPFDPNGNDPYDNGDVDLEVDHDGSNFQIRLLVTSGTWTVTGRRTYKLSTINLPA